MANIYPDQVRAVDPYSSYNSNVVNRLTRMVTRELGNTLHSSHAMDVYKTDSTHITVHTGTAFIDDVVIQITSIYNADLEDADYYYGNPWNEAGYYIVALAYNYVKAKPAPEAAIKIYKPSQHAAFLTSGHLFLKCLQVSFNGFTFQLDQVFDYVPGFPTTLLRKYTQIYAGSENTLQPFDASEDEARIIYVKDKDELYFGTSARWEAVFAIRDNIDTQNCTVGQLGYVASDGAVYPAISTGIATFADCVVLQVGALTTGEGKARLYGRVYGVAVETGRLAVVGENVYLSAVEAGKVTDLAPEPYRQFVGTVVAITGGGTTCDLWFMPGAESTTSDLGASLYDYYQDLLNASIFLRLTVDPFINLDFTDQAMTTSEINVYEHSMDGTSGDVFQSKTLTDPDFDGTCIVSCQISRTCIHGAGHLDWFASNNGGVDWEGPVPINDVHAFSSVKLPTAVIVGTFQYGEIINGVVSGLSAIFCGGTTTSTLVRSVIGVGNWIIGEAINGVSSGASASITAAPIDRDIGYTDLRVKAEFVGNASIDDYGIIYDEDETINEDTIYDSLNIDTLFADLYTTPSQDNDGIANLPVPIQTITTGLTNSHGYGVEEWILGATDTHPSVGDHKALYVVDSTAAVSITTFDDGVDSQLIKLLFVDNDITLVDGPTLNLQGGVNFTPPVDSVINLVCFGNRWYEDSRSVN